MGSASTQALAASVAVLAEQKIDIDAARDLFTASAAIADSIQLSHALADNASPVAAREQLITAVFGSTLGAPAVAVLTAVATQRWSDSAGLLNGVEELAVRAAAEAGKKADIAGELFSFTRTIAENPELELALGSRLGDKAAKHALVEKLIGANTQPATVLIVSSLVEQSRGRRVRQLLNRAINIVADQGKRTVATVTSAFALNKEQSDRLTAALSTKYGTEVSLNVVIDPNVVGGLRVQIADDVIDGSVSARIADVRQKLVG